MQPQSVNPIFFIGQFLLIIGVFYFIVIRPQRNEQKKHREMLASLQKNDEVVTASGIHGTVVNVKDKTVIVRIDDNVKVEMEKSSIAAVKRQPQTSEGK